MGVFETLIQVTTRPPGHSRNVICPLSVTQCVRGLLIRRHLVVVTLLYWQWFEVIWDSRCREYKGLKSSGVTVRRRKWTSWCHRAVLDLGLHDVSGVMKSGIFHGEEVFYLSRRVVLPSGDPVFFVLLLKVWDSRKTDPDTLLWDGGRHVDRRDRCCFELVSVVIIIGERFGNSFSFYVSDVMVYVDLSLVFSTWVGCGNYVEVLL